MKVQGPNNFILFENENENELGKEFRFELKDRGQLGWDGC